MPTYAQLQAEQWWGREIVTPEMDWLGDELCRRTSRPRTAAGTKGDNAHLRGAHRSQEWIKNSRYATSRTYTVQAGLTADQARTIAGFDFTPGSAAEMIAQSKRLYSAMKAGLLNEVREFYGNVNGDQIVDGWDNVGDEPASADSSHLWHWHTTIDRKQTRNRQLMERILAFALGLPVKEDDMTPEQDARLTRVENMLTRPDGREAIGRTYLWLARGYDDVPGSARVAHPTLASLSAQVMGLQAATLAAIKGLDTEQVIEAVNAAAEAEAAEQKRQHDELLAKLDDVDEQVVAALGGRPMEEVAAALLAAGIDAESLAGELLRLKNEQGASA